MTLTGNQIQMKKVPTITSGIPHNLRKREKYKKCVEQQKHWCKWLNKKGDLIQQQGLCSSLPSPNEEILVSAYPSFNIAMSTVYQQNQHQFLSPWLQALIYAAMGKLKPR